MNYTKYSIIKGLLLSGVVVIAGLGLGYLFTPIDHESGTLPAVDLQAWVMDETVLPAYVDIYCAPPYSPYGLPSNLSSLDYPSFPDNISSIRVNHNVSGNDDWSLETVSVDGVLRGFTSEEARFQQFILSTGHVRNLSDALRETVSTVLTGEKMTYEYYKSQNMHWMGGIFCGFYGLDYIRVDVEIYPGGIVVHSRYHNTSVDWRFNDTLGRFDGQLHWNDYLGKDPLTSSDPPLYYFLSKESFEESFQTSYIALWNSTLQALIY